VLVSTLHSKSKGKENNSSSYLTGKDTSKAVVAQSLKNVSKNAPLANSKPATRKEISK
jgi:hypothetical protein